MAKPSVRRDNPFRLNFEQQKKRAKELLRSHEEEEPEAQRRVLAHLPGCDTPRLADAQFVIARELGLASWPALKAHIEAMDRARRTSSALDGDRPTLHIRCGSDIETTLVEGGFAGTFLEYSDALCQGPITDGLGFLEQRARFLSDAYGIYGGFSYEEALDKLVNAENALSAAAKSEQRLVIWTEHDPYDQIVLVRCLTQLEAYGRTESIELVSVNHFPGAYRFIGLGQLPSEALRLLWPQRKAVSLEQMALAAETWKALCSDNPSDVADIARQARASLPDLPRALRRYLQELPSQENGLGLTQRLILDFLAGGPKSFHEAFAVITSERDLLPWLGDLQFMHITRGLADADNPAITITSHKNDAPWHRADLALTETGRRLAAGQADWLFCGPHEYCLGGVTIRPGSASWPNWRWDDARGSVITS